MASETAGAGATPPPPLRDSTAVATAAGAASGPAAAIADGATAAAADEGGATSAAWQAMPLMDTCKQQRLQSVTGGTGSSFQLLLALATQGEEVPFLERSQSHLQAKRPWCLDCLVRTHEARPTAARIQQISSVASQITFKAGPHAIDSRCQPREPENPGCVPSLATGRASTAGASPCCHMSCMKQHIWRQASASHASNQSNGCSHLCIAPQEAHAASIKLHVTLGLFWNVHISSPM